MGSTVVTKLRIREVAESAKGVLVEWTSRPLILRVKFVVLVTLSSPAVSVAHPTVPVVVAPVVVPSIVPVLVTPKASFLRERISPLLPKTVSFDEDVVISTVVTVKACKLLRCVLLLACVVELAKPLV